MDYRERWELKDYLVGQRLARRVVLAHVVIVTVLLLFALNLWYLQGIGGDEYAILAENNRLRRIPMPPARGTIYDRSGMAIAATRPSLNLVLMREGIADLGNQIDLVAPILATTRDALNARLSQMRSRPAFEPLVLEEDVQFQRLARVEARREKFPTIEVQQTTRRSYPNAGLYAHVLGYVGEVSSLEGAAGLQLGDIVGKAGVERFYDEKLRGARGWRVVSVNNLGRRMGPPRDEQVPLHGNPLRLTLNSAMQRALREGLVDRSGAGVFLDPSNGDVLALVSTPTFDPNVFASRITRSEWQALREDPRRPLLNRAIGSFYAPGSTFKVVMAIAGLESGTINPSTTVYCSGSTTIYGHRRLCWKKGGHGSVDLRRALVHSCNVYFYHLGQRMGIDPITRVSEMFNLGKPTGIDLPGEGSGISPSSERKQARLGEPWYAGDTISVAIGQGLLTASPLQMAVMISGVATGRLPRPRLNAETEVVTTPLAVAPATFAVVREGLTDVVSEGTARRAEVSGIRVAGKTGTAQVFKHSAGIDADELPEEERDHAWFVGYAPDDDPRVAFAVIVEHGGHGGTTAAPIVRAVLEAFFNPPKPPVEIEQQDRQVAIAPPRARPAGSVAVGG